MEPINPETGMTHSEARELMRNHGAPRSPAYLALLSESGSAESGAAFDLDRSAEVSSSTAIRESLSNSLRNSFQLVPAKLATNSACTFLHKGTAISRTFAALSVKLRKR